jgi:hypothetical protein
MKQFDIHFVGRTQGVPEIRHRLRGWTSLTWPFQVDFPSKNRPNDQVISFQPLSATRNAEDPEGALLALYDEYEHIAHAVVIDVETGQTSRPSLVECRQVQLCAACHGYASECAVDDIPLCSDCAKALAQIRPDDPVACEACGGSVHTDAQIAWICRKSGGGAYCDHCSFAMNKRTSA